MLNDYEKGVIDALFIIEERGKRIKGAINPERTMKEIKERLLHRIIKEVE